MKDTIRGLTEVINILLDTLDSVVDESEKGEMLVVLNDGLEKAQGKYAEVMGLYNGVTKH